MRLLTYIKSRNKTLLISLIAVVAFSVLLVWSINNGLPKPEEFEQPKGFEDSMIKRDRHVVDGNLYTGLKDGSYLPILRLPISYFSKDDFNGGIWNNAEIKNSDYTKAIFAGDDAYQSFPTTAITFSDWLSDIESLPPVKTKNQINEVINSWPSFYEENLKQHGELTTRFWPEKSVVGKQNFDVDSDGEDELIVSLCGSIGGSAPCPDEIKVMKESVIVFTASGERINVSPSKKSDGFYIEWIDRDTLPNSVFSNCCIASNKKTRFVYEDGEFRPIYEQEVRYFEVINEDDFMCPETYGTQQGYYNDIGSYIRQNIAEYQSIGSLIKSRANQIISHGCRQTELDLLADSENVLDVWRSMDQYNDIACQISFWNRIDKEKILASFEDYKIDEIYTDEIAPLDLNSHYVAQNFKTTIRNSLKNGINFAGHYVIAETGFTGVGSILAVVNAKNGKAYPFPYIAQEGFAYRPDSNLLIVNDLKDLRRQGKIEPEDSDWLCSHYMTNVRPHYFLWENNSFRLLGPRDDRLMSSAMYTMGPSER